MEQWEYKISKLPVKGVINISLDEQQSDSFLNSLGAEGWELITIISTTGMASWGSETKAVYCIFKRKKT